MQDRRSQGKGGGVDLRGWSSKITIDNYMLGLSLMGPPWLMLSAPEGKARGSGQWPLNHTICLFVPIKEA